MKIPDLWRWAWIGWASITAAAWPAAIGVAVAASQPGPEDPHLPVLPRWDAEAARIAGIARPATGFDAPEPFEARPAGAATVPARAGDDAFSRPSANIGFEAELDFRTGNGLFRKLWVSAPSSTRASDGLGPLYNARSCQMCHVRDGRGHPPEAEGAPPVSLVLRLMRPGGDAGGMAAVDGFTATAADPVYGRQLQPFGVPGQRGEYRLRLRYDEIPVPLAGGEVAQLRAPRYDIADPGYGPLHPETRISPRVAPQMIGLGLLEAIPAADILAHADEGDADGDGISGRANMVWSVEFQRPMLGRFGLKAGQPTLRQQSARAFADDIGISTPLFPAGWGDCTATQPACRAAPHGDGDARGAEADAQALDLVTHYSRNLAVPARRGVDEPRVLRGKRLFYRIGCQSCHVPKFVTHRLQDRPGQSFQLIWPYSDLLLHDMGPGLADGAPEGRATGREWRTAPLWGIGMTPAVAGRGTYLHDGRARSLLEAVLWHGGEAQPHRDAVIALSPADRAALIRFLESL